ncbi:aldo-keto reductase family 1 member B1-like [Galleria mellonella]|uniref:Aldo-keto reductase family 1 member B1-like n=1 Tax=Galleria mellonella TaxID=7137 RepID=A0A6J1WHZ9_GALME|nr:aldo-keto reductase family 1 member B1-like [Galleria mellonella]
MAEKVPLVRFNNGLNCPILGLGTWQAIRGEESKVYEAVCDAIDIGYRHIDGAHLYGNEKEVGQAIKEKISQGVVKRENLFVTSKLWNTFHSPDWVETAVKLSLSDLGLEYLDLYLIHWPMAYKEGYDLEPVDENGKTIFSDVDYVDTWRAMEKLVEKGLVKSIGVSNFNTKQIDRVLEIAKIKPVTNQVEVHPYLYQQKLYDFCNTRDIVLTAYSPLGSPQRPWAQAEDPNVLEDPVVKKIAAKHGKTPAQVIIRSAVDRGIIVVPKSASKKRLAENFDIWDFKLSNDDQKEISRLDRNFRVIPHDHGREHKDYPFSQE